MILVYGLFVLVVLLLLYYVLIERRKYISRMFPKIELGVVHSAKISVLTYNVAGLPQRISSAQTPRRESMALIGKKFNDFDIVNVQEDFNYNVYLYSENVHGYRTMSKGKVPFGDGLNTLSNFPILEYHRIPWRHCTGTDCLTPKGFSLTKIKLAKNITLDVYNVHANSSDHPRAARARTYNFQQLAQYICDHSADRPLLVMGDFNANYTYSLDSLPDFLKKTGLQDVWIQIKRKGIYPQPDPDFQAYDLLSITDEMESIDKVYYRNSENLHFEPLIYKVESRLFVDEDKNPLSDHLGISVELVWKWSG